MTRLVVHNHIGSQRTTANDALPMNSTGKYASDWSRIMGDLRERKPRPVNKLWNNPASAPPEQVAAAEQKIREWNREYSYANRMQKKALEEDNANFRKQQSGLDAQMHPRSTPTYNDIVDEDGKVLATVAISKVLQVKKRLEAETGKKLHLELSKTTDSIQESNGSTDPLHALRQQVLVARSNRLLFENAAHRGGEDPNLVLKNRRQAEHYRAEETRLLNEYNTKLTAMQRRSLETNRRRT